MADAAKRNTLKPVLVNVDLGTRKAGLNIDDIESVAQVMALAWKRAGMPQGAAIEYAVLTIVLFKDGTPNEKMDAESTIMSALQWEIFGGKDLAETIRLKLQCMDLVQHHLFRGGFPLAKPLGQQLVERMDATLNDFAERKREKPRGLGYRFGSWLRRKFR